jgi:hypothetical protein
MGYAASMIDMFTLALSHGLIALAAWRLVGNAELDRDPPVAESEAAAGRHAETIRRD